MNSQQNGYASKIRCEFTISIVDDTFYSNYALIEKGRQLGHDFSRKMANLNLPDILYLNCVTYKLRLA